MKILKEVIIRYQTEDGRIVKAYEQEELVRCKDCKHNNDGRCTWHNSLNYSWVVDDDDYCSCAERKEE